MAIFRAAFLASIASPRLALRAPPAWLGSVRGANAVSRRHMCSAAAPGWESLGMVPHLLAAVQELGLPHPTHIQTRAFPAIRGSSLSDVVIAGETGIGKTLAYLLPVIDALLSERLGGAAPHTGEPEMPAEPGVALVLQPNADLAFQAAAVAAQLLAGSGLRVVNLHAPHDPDAVRDCHVLVGTPPRVLDVAPLERVRFAVLDEADSLLSGSFKVGARQKYPIEQLLLELRKEERTRALELRTAAAAAAEGSGAGEGSGDEGAGVAEARALPLQHILVGATVPAHGTRNVRARVQQLFPRAEWVQSEGLHRTVRRLQVRFVRVAHEPEREGARGREQGEGYYGFSAAGGREPRDERGLPSREQALADALMRPLPNAGEAAAATEAEALEPHAQPLTLIFANTMPAVQRALDVLERLQVPAAAFHKGVPVEVRRETLLAFQRGELRALVSTGLAARGLDLAGVERVVEFELAQNVVEHLHRVGRTARADRQGQATCLVGLEDEDLARAIQAGLDAGTGIETAVSRNRSFRQGIKRFGQAQAGSAAGQQAELD